MVGPLQTFEQETVDVGRCWRGRSLQPDGFRWHAHLRTGSGDVAVVDDVNEGKIGVLVQVVNSAAHVRVAGVYELPFDDTLCTTSSAFLPIRMKKIMVSP